MLLGGVSEKACPGEGRETLEHRRHVPRNKCALGVERQQELQKKKGDTENCGAMTERPTSSVLLEKQHEAKTMTSVVITKRKGKISFNQARTLKPKDDPSPAKSAIVLEKKELNQSISSSVYTLPPVRKSKTRQESELQFAQASNEFINDEGKEILRQSADLDFKSLSQTCKPAEAKKAAAVPDFSATVVVEKASPEEEKKERVVFSWLMR